MHNSSGADRVAMVCRYAPWWLSTQVSRPALHRPGICPGPPTSRTPVQEFSGNQVGYLSVSDWEALPERLQPLLRHLVVDPSREPRQPCCLAARRVVCRLTRTLYPCLA